MFHVVFCILLLDIHMYALVDQLPRFGKRELIFCYYLLVIMWFLFGEISSSSGCLGWAALFYCGTPIQSFMG